MQITVSSFIVNKRFPLTISRGTTSQTTNIWLRLEEDGIEGWGEASPFSVVGEESKDSDRLKDELEQITPSLAKYSPDARQEIEEMLEKAQVSSSAKAAIDMALYDWLGKKAGLPLWRLWGLDIKRIVPTSVTIGINSPEGAKERLRNWLNFMDVQIVKIKLGNPSGIDADKEMFLAIKEEVPSLQLTVDANGGWSLYEAIIMCDWLATLGVKYVEQPLAVGKEDNLPLLKARSPLPIFVDESCFNTTDIIKLAGYGVDGINIKIMKAGGLNEAIRMIHVAKACRLQIMYGCYSDSSLANTAMSHLAPLADYIDLDSHLNLLDDPFTGVILEKGCLLPRDLPGLGVGYCVNRG